MDASEIELSSNSSENVRFHLSRESKRKIYSATISAVIVVLTVGQAHAGFLFVLLVLPLAVWLGWSAFVIVRRPYARLAQMICLLIWALAISLVVAAHSLRHEFARRDADRIAASIDRFRADNGHCAASLETMGIRPGDVEEKLGANYSYSCQERKPRFSYVATFTILDTYDYDFEQDRWKYSSWIQKKSYLNTNPPVVAGDPVNPSVPAPQPDSRPAPRRKP